MTLINTCACESYKPIIKLDNGNGYTINFDKVDLFVNKIKEVNGLSIVTDELIPSGQCQYSSFTIKKLLSPEKIVEKIHTIIDEETSCHIINDFVWNDYKVRLTKENQMNYKNAFDLAIATDGESLPVTFKFYVKDKPVYFTFDTTTELKSFYIDVNKYINESLIKGWERKDKVSAEDYKI